MATRRFAFRILEDALRNKGLDGKSKVIINFVGAYGPLSIPSIQKKIKAACKALKLKNPNSKADFKIELGYTEIERRIEKLKTLELIQEPNYYFHKASTRIIALTFKGLLWYFRETQSLSKGKIDHFFKSYQKPYLNKSKHRKNRFLLESYKQLMPFCPLWKGMVDQIGAKCLNRLNWTIQNFYVDEKAFFKIEPLEIEVETFPNYSGECTDRIFSFEKDLTVADYLKREGATLLREAYVAYLINEDLNFIRYMDANEIEQEVPKLKSMSEFNFFRSTDKAEPSLLSKEGLSKFFPKYSGKEYYFTGMFVNNLLWDKKSKVK